MSLVMHTLPYLTMKKAPISGCHQIPGPGDRQTQQYGQQDHRKLSRRSILQVEDFPLELWTALQAVVLVPGPRLPALHSECSPIHPKELLEGQLDLQQCDLDVS